MQISFTKRDFWLFIREAQAGSFKFGELEFNLEFNEFLKPKEFDKIVFFKDYFLFQPNHNVFQLSLEKLSTKYPDLLNKVNNFNAYDVALKQINRITVKKFCPSCSSDTLVFTLPRRIVLLEHKPIIIIDLICTNCRHCNNNYCECEYCQNRRLKVQNQTIELLVSHFNEISKYLLPLEYKDVDPISSSFIAWQEILKKHNKGFGPISEAMLLCFKNRVISFKDNEPIEIRKILSERYFFNEENLDNIGKLIEKLGNHYIPEFFLTFASFNELALANSYNELLAPTQDLNNRKYSNDAFIEFAVKVARIHEINISNIPDLTREKILELASVLSEDEVFYIIKLSINEAIRHFKLQNQPRLSLKKLILSYLNTAIEKLPHGFKSKGIIVQEELKDTWHIWPKVLPPYHSFAMNHFKDQKDLINTLNKCFY